VRGIVTLAGIALLTIGVMASASGPVPARTGGFGEPSCHECHWNNELNDPSGRLTLSGVPEDYSPGRQYLITVALAHPELVRGGFQLSARFEDGTNAGTFANTGPATETVPDEAGRVFYAQQTKAGSAAPVKGAARWEVEWTAPAAGRAGPILFHVAANAANGDASPLSDFVYTATGRTTTVDPR
jgi:hypothetical protein